MSDSRVWVTKALYRHILFQLGAICNHLDTTDDDDDVSVVLRSIKTGSSGSFSSRIDRDTSELRQEYSPDLEFSKSDIFQQFVRDINSSSRYYRYLAKQPPEAVPKILVYRSLSISSEKYHQLLNDLLEQSKSTEPIYSPIFPHPIPFSASWTTDLSINSWRDANVTLEILLPHNYQFLSLSTPFSMEIDPTRLCRSIRRILNQSQQELMIMPSYFIPTGNMTVAQAQRDSMSHLLLQVMPLPMSRKDQAHFLRLHADESSIEWEEGSE